MKAINAQITKNAITPGCSHSGTCISFIAHFLCARKIADEVGVEPTAYGFGDRRARPGRLSPLCAHPVWVLAGSAVRIKGCDGPLVAAAHMADPIVCLPVSAEAFGTH